MSSDGEPISRASGAPASRSSAVRWVAWPRVAFRFLGLLVYAVAFFLSWLVALPPTLISARLRRAWRDASFRGWSRAVLWLLGARVEVTGQPPRAPFLLVANHLSYLDVPVLGTLFDAVFVARADVAHWPIIGPLTKVMDTVFLDRESARSLPRVIAEMDELLARGRAVVVFPEGTSSPGVEVLPFQSSILAGAARASYPVHHAALSYSTPSGAEPAHLSVCWWGDMTLLGHFVHLFALPHFTARVAFGSEPLRDLDRKRLAQTLHSAVAREFLPVVSSEELCNQR